MPISRNTWVHSMSFVMAHLQQKKLSWLVCACIILVKAHINVCVIGRRKTSAWPQDQGTAAGKDVSRLLPKGKLPVGILRTSQKHDRQDCQR